MAYVFFLLYILFGWPNVEAFIMSFQQFGPRQKPRQRVYQQAA